MCRRHTGLPPESFIGKAQEELGLAPDGWAWDEVIRRVFKTGLPEGHKGTIHLAKGTFIFNWRVFPESGPDRKVRGVVSVARDITEQEKVGQKLSQQSQQSQQSRRLRAVSRRLVEIQEAERRRLSGELHDQLGQNLTALGINLDIVRGELPARLIISDSGCGFRTDVERRGDYRGYGLILMQERADAIGASLRTQSGPGEGTQVIVELSAENGDPRTAG